MLKSPVILRNLTAEPLRQISTDEREKWLMRANVNLYSVTCRIFYSSFNLFFTKRSGPPSRPLIIQRLNVPAIKGTSPTIIKIIPVVLRPIEIPHIIRASPATIRTIRPAVVLMNFANPVLAKDSDKLIVFPFHSLIGGQFSVLVIFIQNLLFKQGFLWRKQSEDVEANQW